MSGKIVNIFWLVIMFRLVGYIVFFPKSKYQQRSICKRALLNEKNPKYFFPAVDGSPRQGLRVLRHRPPSVRAGGLRNGLPHARLQDPGEDQAMNVECRQKSVDV